MTSHYVAGGYLVVTLASPVSCVAGWSRTS